MLLGAAWHLAATQLASWLMDVFQETKEQPAAAAAAARMASAQGPQPSSSGPLSFMGCMRESSPAPFDCQQQQQQRERERERASFDCSMPKEPKKRRFHPLRGLRRIFRKKSRGAADSRGCGADSEASAQLAGLAMRLHDREEVTLRDPAGGRPEEIRSRSASELLTDSCDRDRLFLRRRGLEDAFASLQRNSAQLSVSHDSVFPGEVGHARPLSSLDAQPSSLERRTGRASNHQTDQHKEPSQPSQKHRISLRVLEQIKTVIENRNQIAAGTATTTTTTTTTTTSAAAAAAAAATETANSLHNRFSSRDKSSSNSSNSSNATAAAASEEQQAKVPRKDAPTPSSTSLTDCWPLKEDLPELTATAGQLSHTAALHRISVRPKNRRPPRRSSSNGAISTSNGLPRVESISENSIDTLDSLETASLSLAPQQQQQQQQQQREASKPIPIVRKSSSRNSSELLDGLEATKPPTPRRAAVSPDSLEFNLDSGSAGFGEAKAELCEEAAPKPSPRSASVGSPRPFSNRLSKSPDSLEADSSSPPPWLSKSTEGLAAAAAAAAAAATAEKPVPAKRLLLKPISKSQERVCYGKSSDSLEALQALNSDDAMERRRSSFEIRARGQKPVHKAMSKSTECFDSTLYEQQQQQQQQQQHDQQQQQQTLAIRAEEKPKRASFSEINLSRGSSSRYRRLLLLSKSSENFEKSSSLVEPEKREERPPAPNQCWRSSRRLVHSQSESSDNLDYSDSKDRRRSAGKIRLGANHFADEQQDSAVARKPSDGARLQRSSESSELGSTDTLDSERRNTIKSSDSEETLDSLEKELQELHGQQDNKDEETTESILEKRDKLNEETEDEKLDSYWRRRANSQESKESGNLDIHQLLAYSLVTRIQENGNNDNADENNQREEDKSSPKSIGSTAVLAYPKKKLLVQHTTQQQQQQSSSEENKTLTSTINNLLSSKTDEDLQNMLNGNISEVSTDTKSFKEKLIMFEKLGK